MKKSLILALVFSFGSALSFAQASRDERQAEQATEAQNGVYDTVDITSDPAVSQITRNSAVLQWTTNKVAATRVNYGLDPNNLSQSAYLPGGSTNHQVVLRDLRPGTTYYFAIENKHGRGRLTGTFQTQ